MIGDEAKGEGAKGRPGKLLSPTGQSLVRPSAHSLPDVRASLLSASPLPLIPSSPDLPIPLLILCSSSALTIQCL